MKRGNDQGCTIWGTHKRGKCRDHQATNKPDRNGAWLGQREGGMAYVKRGHHKGLGPEWPGGVTSHPLVRFSCVIRSLPRPTAIIALTPPYSWHCPSMHARSSLLLVPRCEAPVVFSCTPGRRSLRPREPRSIWPPTQSRNLIFRSSSLSGDFLRKQAVWPAWRHSNVTP